MWYIIRRVLSIDRLNRSTVFENNSSAYLIEVFLLRKLNCSLMFEIIAAFRAILLS